MIRVYIFVEGQTEETFVNRVLYDYFYLKGIFLFPILITTSPNGKGGIGSYQQVKRQIVRQCKQEQAAFVTSMFDLFRLPTDFPSYSFSLKEKDPLRRAEYLEKSMEEDINQNNFIANLVVHEFEALLFSEPQKFEIIFGNNVVKNLLGIRNQFISPEHINGGPNTAPSKRILKLCPRYEKIANGSDIAKNIGINVIVEQCPHFRSWIERLNKQANTFPKILELV